MWDEYDSFMEAKIKILSLKVMTNAADISVKLIQDFNRLITTEEEQKQLFLHYV